MAKHDKMTAQDRKATSVSLDMTLVAEAQRLGINISRACEAGLAQQIATKQGRLWKADNAAMLHGYVERHSLPLGPYRRF
jgi:antitoxin CcdA